MNEDCHDDYDRSTPGALLLGALLGNRIVHKENVGIRDGGRRPRLLGWAQAHWACPRPIGQPQPTGTRHSAVGIRTSCSRPRLDADCLLAKWARPILAHMPRNRIQFARQFLRKTRAFYRACSCSSQFGVRRSLLHHRKPLTPRDSSVGSCSLRAHRARFRCQWGDTEKSRRQGRYATLMIARLPQCVRRMFAKSSVARPKRFELQSPRFVVGCSPIVILRGLLPICNPGDNCFVRVGFK